MPKRSRKTAKSAKPKRQPERDENQMAFDALQQIIQRTDGTGKNPLAVALGRLGGLKGGHARAQRMTKTERSESARKAAKARWADKKQS